MEDDCWKSWLECNIESKVYQNVPVEYVKFPSFRNVMFIVLFSLNKGQPHIFVVHSDTWNVLPLFILFITPHPLLFTLRKNYRKWLGGTTKGGRQRPGFPNFNPDRIFRSKTFSCPRLCNATVGSMVSPCLSTPFGFPDNHFHPC